MLPPRMRFGAFIAPFHPVNENPGLCIERDLQLVELMDQLGYDEAWIGEHHSAGYEVIASPEIFIAVAAERTRHIRLGTGVVSLPYHHPLMLADRINQLDHMTRGRVIFGIGPGQLPSDAFMMGIDVSQQRRMMAESLEVLVPLLSGEKVTSRTDWFELCDAQLQMAPFTRPHVEMAAAASFSPAGPVAAGRYGIGMLNVAATSEQGFQAIAHHWDTCEQAAKQNDQRVERSQWRLVGPMHVAETREQALEDVRHGILDFLHYFQEILPTPLTAASTVEEAVEGLRRIGIATIGTPEDAVEQIERLQKQSGGFGAFLFLDHNWAPWDRKQRSYELFARYVMPRFQQGNDRRIASLAWAKGNKATFIGALMGAIGSEIQRHTQEQQARKQADTDGSGEGGAS